MVFELKHCFVARIGRGSVVWVALLACLLSACASRDLAEEDLGPDISGPPVSRINFTGNESFGAGALRGAMSTKGKPLLQFWKSGEPYDPQILEADMLRLRKFYFDRGFLEARAEISGVEESEEDETVEIEVAVEEGPRTTVESIRIAGEVPPELPEEQVLLRDLPLLPGDFLEREAFESSRARLLRALQDRGFARAKIVPATAVDKEAHRASIVFTLEPGLKAKFGEVSVSGNTQVEDYVVLRQLSFSEGDPYNAQLVQDSQDDIFGLNLFRAVTPRILNMEEEGAPVDMEFDLRESKPRSGRLGVGVSSVESVRYQVEWRNRNLFSEAETFDLSASVSRYFQTLEAKLHEPFFLNRKTSMTYRLFGINQTTITTDPLGIVRKIFDIKDPFPAYDFVRGGGSWSIEHDFTRKFGGEFGLEFTATDFYNIDNDASDEVLDGVENNQLFIQYLEGQWNRRDNDINPRRGQLYRAKLEHSNEDFFSDSSFFKLGVDARHYFPVWRRSTFGLRLKVGAIKPYNDQGSIPSNVRFYAGGPGSVRGYAINRLGPQDSDNNPIGGNSLLEGSAEFRFPVVGSVIGNAFVDFGNVFQSTFTYRPQDLKFSVGAGLGYSTPIGPLRFEVAIAIDEDDDENTSPFIFSIGHAF